MSVVKMPVLLGTTTTTTTPASTATTSASTMSPIARTVTVSTTATRMEVSQFPRSEIAVMSEVTLTPRGWKLHQFPQWGWVQEVLHAGGGHYDQDPSLHMMFLPPTSSTPGPSPTEGDGWRGLSTLNCSISGIMSLTLFSLLSSPPNTLPTSNTLASTGVMSTRGFSRIFLLQPSSQSSEAPVECTIRILDQSSPQTPPPSPSEVSVSRYEFSSSFY